MAIQPITSVKSVNSGGVNTLNTPVFNAADGNINTLLVPGNTLPARQSLLGTIEKAGQLGIPHVGNYLSGLVSELAARDSTNKGLYDLYDSFGNNLYQMMGDRNSFYGSLNQDVLGELSKLQQQYRDTYGPQGSMTNKVNQLYGNYGNYLLNKNAADRAYSSGLASKYGLSDNARRIAENDVGLQGLSEALKIFDAETQSLDNINKTFNTLTTDAFSKYKGVQDDYLKSLYDSNFGIQTQLAQGLLNLLGNNEQMKTQMALQKQYSGGGSTSGTGTRTSGLIPQQTQSTTTQGGQVTYQGMASKQTKDGVPYVEALGSDGKTYPIGLEQWKALVDNKIAK